jgi:hypothetical protein
MQGFEMIERGAGSSSCLDKQIRLARSNIASLVGGADTDYVLARLLNVCDLGLGPFNPT